MDAQYTRRDESKLLLSVTGAAAEDSRDEISRRIRRGLEDRARAAQPASGRAYGYVVRKDPPSGRVRQLVDNEIVLQAAKCRALADGGA